MTARRGTRCTLGSTALAVAVLVGVGGCESGGTGPEYVADLLFEPDSVYLEPGQSVEIRAMPLGPRDQPYPDRAERVEWTVTASEVLDTEVSAPGVLTVTGLEVGSGEVHASLGRAEEAARVYVQPPGLASIEIEPSSITLRRFTGIRPRAVLRNAQGNEISPEGYRLSWWAGDDDILFVVPNTRLNPVVTISARQVGTTRLHLKVGPLTTSVVVTITPRN